MLCRMLINLWPGFGGSLAAQTEAGAVTATRFYGIANTILCLAGSSIAAFAASSGLGNKLNMVHIQNSTLAGGVAISSACEMNLTPAGSPITNSGLLQCPVSLPTLVGAQDIASLMSAMHALSEMTYHAQPQKATMTGDSPHAVGALLIGVLSGLLSVYGYSVITPAIEDTIGLQVS